MFQSFCFETASKSGVIMVLFITVNKSCCTYVFFFVIKVNIVWFLFSKRTAEEKICADYWMWRGDSILKEGTRENNMRMKICNLGNSRLWFITHQETEGFDLYRMECVMRKNWNWTYFLGQRCAPTVVITCMRSKKSVLLLKYPYCFKREKTHLLMEQYCIHNTHTCACTYILRSALTVYALHPAHNTFLFSSPCSTKVLQLLFPF